MLVAMSSEIEDVSRMPKLAAELAKDVSLLLKKLEPWKAIMPEQLRGEMEKVETKLRREVDDSLVELGEE